ncbi:MAG: hypothetical protein ABIT20_09360 [Gemmatimonadaceae bacterium]
MRAAVVFMLVCLARIAYAQDAAQVVLRLHPRVGDTLHTWLDQQTEVTALMPGAAARSVTTTIAIHSRTIVRSVQQLSTTVLTIVDSAKLTSTDAHAAEMIAETQRALQGQQLNLQLGTDGSVESARDARGNLVPHDVAEALAAMPAVFPRRPVAVGQEWTREMPLPSGGPFGAKGSGHVKAVFHLDSLRKKGAVAYVSMRGDILPDSVGRGVELSGSIAGAMQLDRVRGWMTDSRIVITLRSLIAPPPSMGLAPMKFMTRVTQRLRTMDKH